MNKLRYRIVFNKARGMCMVVAETARSRTKAPGQGVVDSSVSGVMRLPALRQMAILVGIGLGGVSLAGAAVAQIVADPTAPGQQRATVLNAANGVAQVNIQTPSAAGVSRNVYSQFDVPKGGAILNNSRTNVQTQLGGWVQGNPWLSTGTARVILNEVRSSNPSRLQGYIEVAGDRAETIIANPAGIVVDGGGFINVSRATLTTGSPIFEEGRLKGYSVQRGQIVVDGAGLDASKTDHTALIARSLQVNAGLWAQRLNVITGVNEVAEAEQAVVTQAGQASDAPPLYAVDVARLGGMYANHIYLVGTEAGVGVHNAGAIGAAAGDLVVTVNGRLENSGMLSAARRLQASATGIDNQGPMQAGETLALTAGSMVNAGQIASGREVLIAVHEEIDNSHGRIEATRIDLTGAALRNNQGSIVQSGAQAMAIDAVDVINTAGTLGQHSVAATTGTTTTVDVIGGASGSTGSFPGQTTAQDGASADTGSPTASAPAPLLSDGRLQVGLLENTSGAITTNGEAVLRTRGLDNRAGQVLLGSLAVSGPAFDNTGGTLTVLRNFDANTERFINDQGKLLVGAVFNGALGTFSNRQGLLQASQLSVNVTGQLDNSGGTLRHLGNAATALVVGGELALDKGVLDITGALRLQAGAISGRGSAVSVAGDLAVDSGVTSTVQGHWTIGGGASLRIDAADNSGGAISVAQGLDLVSGALANAGGTIVAGGDVSISASGAVDNSGGTIQAARDLALVSSDVVQNRAGSIGTLANTSTLSVTGAVIDNGDGRIANVGTGRTVLAADSITGRGLIGGNGDVAIAACTLSNQAGGTLASQGHLELAVDAALVNAGRIDAGGNLRMMQDAAQLNNSGVIAAQGRIDIAVASVDNSLGTLATVAGSGSQLSLISGRLANRSGAIQADGAATLLIRGDVGNEGGHIRSGEGLSLDATGRIENRGGGIESTEGLQLHGAEIGNDGGRIAAAGIQASVIEADRIIGNNGLIGANGQLTLRTQTLNSGAVGTISAVGDLELAVSSVLTNRGGIINTAGTLAFDQKQATLVNSGAITAGAGVRLNLDRTDNRGGSINSLQGAGLALHANTLDNQGGRLMAGSDALVHVMREADNGDGVMQAAGSIDVAVGGTLRNHGGAIEALSEHGTLAVQATTIDNGAGRITGVGDGNVKVSAAGHIASSGLIAGNGQLELLAVSLDNAGTINSAVGMELAVSNNANNSGTISAAAGLHAGQPNMALRNSGAIVAGGPIELALGMLDNASGRIATAQGSGADVVLTAQSIGNEGGAITGERDLTLRVASDLDGRGGLLQAKGKLELNAGGLVDVSGGGIETLSTDSSLQLHAGAVLNEAGRIVNAGSGDTRVHADTALVNNGQIAGNGMLGVEAQSVRNQAGGSVVAGGALALQAHDALDNAGTISSGAGLTMDEGSAALSNHGAIVAARDIVIRAGAIDNDGGTLATANGSGASLNLHGASLTNRGGRIVAERRATLGIKGELDNNSGRISGVDMVRVTAGTALSNDGGGIEATGADAALVLQAQDLRNGDGRIVNVGQGRTTISVADGLINGGLVAGNGMLDLQAAIVVNGNGGTLASSGAMTAAIGSRFENAGTVNSGATLDVAARTAAVANSGLVVANGALNVASAGFDNSGGQLATASGSGAGMVLDATSISNRGGAILSNRDAQVSSAAAFDNTGGTLQAAGSLRLSAVGAADNHGGIIETLGPDATLSVQAGLLYNGNGRIVNVGSGATGVTVDGMLASRGLIAGNGSLDVAAGELDNQTDGSIVSGNTLRIDATRGLGNSGTISSQDALTLGSATGSVANHGTIVSGAGATIDTAKFDNDGGQLVTTVGSRGDIRLNSGDVSNVGGAVTADGAVRISTAGAIDNRQGAVRANTAMAIDAVGALGNQHGVIEAADAGATLDVRARSIDNSAGRLANVGTGATSVMARDDIVNDGTLAGNGSVDLSASGLRNQTGGTIAAGAALDLHVTQALDNAGRISAGAALSMDQARARIANSGGIVAIGDLALHGAAIANDDGQIATLSGAGIDLRSESTLSNRAGVIAAAGDASLGAQGNFDNTGGQVQTPGHLRVSVDGTLSNAGGTLETAGGASTLALQAAFIDNTAGRIVNTGSGQTSIASASAIVNSGTIGGNGALAISTHELQNTSGGTIVAGTTLDLAVRRQLENAGSIGSGAGLHADLAAAIFKNSGTIGAGGNIDITASEINNQGGQLSTAGDPNAAIRLATGSLDNSRGTMSTDGQLQVQATNDISNDGGTLHGGTGATLDAGGVLANGSGIIEAASGTLALQAGAIDSIGRIINAGTGATAIQAMDAVVNGGTIAGNGALVLAGQTLRNSRGGVIGSGADFELAVRQQLDNAGTISSEGALSFDQTAADFGNSGRIGARGSIGIAAATIDNGSGQMYTVGDSGAAITLRAQSLDNIGGTVSADGLLRTETADGVANSGGILHGGAGVALIMAGGLENGTGTIESAAGALDIQARGIDSSGRIANAGTGQTTIVTTTDIVNSGTIGGNGALALSAQALQNADSGTIASGAAMDLAVRRQLDNAGRISSRASLHIGQASANLSNTGSIEADGPIDITAAVLANRGGQLYTVASSGAAVKLGTESLDNTGGTISADGLLRAQVAGGIANDGGTLHGGTGATLQAGGMLANAGGVIESVAGVLDIRAQSVDSSGRIVNAGTGETAIVSSMDLVNGGTIAANGQLALSGRAMVNTGTISAGGAIDISAAAVTNRGGQLYTVNQSGAAIQVNTGGLDNTDGTVSADGLLAVAASEAIANGGGILHGGTGAVLNAGATLANGSGTIESAAGTLGIQARSVESNGRIVNAGTGQTTIASATSIVNAGMIAGNGALGIAAATLLNTGNGTIGSGAGLDLAVRGWLDNGGMISSAGTLHFDHAAASFGNTGRIGAGGPIDITAATLANHGGQLYTVNGSGASIRLQVGSLDNAGGTVSADSLLRAEVAGRVANDGGTLHGGTSATLVAGGAVDNGSGIIEAAAGTLELQAASIDSSGRIVNAGTGATTIGSASSIVNGGTIAGNGAITLSAQALENKGSGTIGSGADLELAVRQRMDNAGMVSSAGTLYFDQTAASFGNSGIIGAGGDIAVTAAAVSNSGGQLYTVSGSGAAITLRSGSVDNTGGMVSADSLLQAAIADNIFNNGGTLHGGSSVTLHAAGTLANGSGTIEAAAGALEVRAQSIDSSGHIVNAGTGQTSVGSTTSIVNSGTIAGNGVFAVSAQTLQNTGSGAIGSGVDLDLAVSQRLDNAGTISSGANLHFDQAAASFGNTGSIGAAGTIDITAASIANRGGQLVTAGGSDAAITLSAGSLDNTGGMVSADGLLGALVSGNTVNSGGTLHGGSGTTLNSSGTLANGGGTIEVATGTLQLQVTSIDNMAGRIVNAGSGVTSIGSATDIDNSGTIAGNGELVLAAQTLRNTGSGVISSGTAMELAVRQQLVNAGSIGSGSSLRFDQAVARIENTGRIGAAGSIDISAATVGNVGGQLYTVNGSEATISLHTGSLDNARGSVSADGMLLAQVGGSAVNSGGVLHAGAGAALDVGGSLTNGSGTIEAATGTLQIQAASVDSSGRIVNAGTGGTRIDSATSIVNGGTIAGNGALTVTAETLQNTAGGAIGTGDGAALELAVRQQLANAGTISSGGNLHVDQAAANFINTGRIGAAGNIDITANTIDNAGGHLYTVSQTGAAIGLRTGGLDNFGGTIAADGMLGVEVGGDVANNAGTLHGGTGTTLNAGGALANGTGMIEARSGALEINAQSIDSSGRIVNGGTGATRIASISAITNSGSIGGNGSLDLHASALQNQGGQITSGGALLLDVRQMVANTGTIGSGGTLTFDQAGASFTNSGEIVAAGDIRLTASSLDNNGGQISTVRGAGGDVTLAASSLSNRGGAILSDGDASLSIAGPVDNNQGVLQAGANLTLHTNGKIDNDGGVIEALGSGSTLSLDGIAIDNGSGRISNAGSGDTRLLAQVGINNGGAIAGMGNVLLSGQTFSNVATAMLASGNNLTLALSQQLGNQGKVNSAGTLTFDQAGATFTNGGEVYSGGNTVIHANTVNNDGGRLGTGSGSGADLVLTSQQLSNQGGRIATDGDLAVNTHTISALGELFGGRDLALSMDGDFVQSGVQQVRSNRNLSVSVTGNIYNGSTLAAAGTLALSAQNISNHAGAAVEGMNVVLSASYDLTNNGEVNGQDTLDIRASTIGNLGGMVGSNVTLAAGRLDNVGPAALIGATWMLNLGVSSSLNNTGGATLYSSGDMTIGGRDGGSAEAVNNISSTIEAAGDLTLNAASLSNVRENVQIVQKKTVDETVHMAMPSWFQYGDNHNAFETSAANYRPHEVYFVSPSDILEDEVYWTPDGNKIHRAVIRTHVNDSAFYIASTGLYGAYGNQSRLTLSEGTRIIYYMESAEAANPDQGGAASNAIVKADSVTNWSSTVSFSNQYGNCSSDCIRLITQPGYTDPRTTRILDDLRALAPVKEQLEVTLDAHHVAVEDQLAPDAGANAQILSGGNMHLTVGSVFENRFGDIKARGGLLIDGSAPINNVGATLYRTHTFDGTWRTYGGQNVSYQRPTISEAISAVKGVIDGEQGVSINGRSFSNIDITAGTVSNIQDAVNVIGSGVSGASSAGAHLAAAASTGGRTGLQVAAGNGTNATAGTKVAAGTGNADALGTFVSATAGIDGKVGTDVKAAAGIDGAAGTRIEADAGMAGTQATAGAGLHRGASTVISAATRADGTVDVRAVAGGTADAGGIGKLSGTAMDAGLGLGGAIASTGSGSGLSAALHAAASGVSNRLQAGEEAAGAGYANDAVASGAATVSGAANDVAVNGAAQQSGAVNDGRLGGKVAATRNDTRLGNVLTSGAPAVGQQAGNVQGAAMGSVVKVNPSGLFLRNPDASGSYLFETRPQFANQQQWTSSDYLLKQLAFDPATTQKRLGDGFYEQRLVREQLAELTGHASYSGASDDSIYKELLTNAVSAAREFGLRPGVALSAEQVSRLTSDIVWMESQTVMLPDGSTETVLAPKVYLAHVSERALQPGGALVTGNGVTINTTESIANTGGVIDDGNGRTVLVAAQDIVNQGGSINGGSVVLAAERDVRNESFAVTENYDFGQNSGSYVSLSNQASIAATGTLDIMAGRDLNDLAGKISAGSANLTAGRDISFGTIKTGSTYQSQISGYTEKDSSITHQLSQISTAGDLRMAATGDLKLSGTQVAIGTAGSGSGQLLAGGSINISAVTNALNTSVQNDPRSKQYDKQVHENQTVVGVGVSATGGLTVAAGLIEKSSLNVTGSSLVAGDVLKLTASDSVNIVSTQEQHLSDTAITRSSSSLLKSKTTQQADYVASSRAMGSSVSGKTVEVSAGKDINVLGSAIAGDGDVSLAAAGSVNIGAATSTLTEKHYSQVKESGFLSGGGFGISYGTRTITTEQSRDATTQSGQSRSMVGSLGGNLDIVAGDAIKVSGSDLAAGLNMTLDGRSVVINPGQDDSTGKFNQTTVQDGLTLAIGGSVVNAIQTFQSMGSAAAQSKDTRIKALAAAAAVMAAKDAIDDMTKNGPSVKVSLTVGHSESESTEVTASSTHGGSVLTAGNNVTISATGGGKASNIDIVGSDVHASGSVLLAADYEVNLLAAQDTDSQHSQSKSMSAAVGVAAEISSSGAKYGFTVSASASRGNVDGEGTTEVNSHVIASDRLTIATGGDANLKGAVASGSQVVADVKGNLNIESLQDMATLDGKRQSASASGTLGVGAGFSASISQSRVHNDYASVQEQSGIRAGDGGFQVQVTGNTDLKGGVISSSEQAIKDGRNSMATTTFSFSDIQNRDSSEASGVSLGVNIGKNQNGGTFSPSIAPGIGQVSGSQDSVTRSGISEGTLTVADQQPGQAVANLNRDVITGKDTTQALTKSWTGAQALDEVGAQMQITSAAMPRLAKEIGDYAESKVAELKKQGNAEEAAKWAEGGVYRVAAHAALGVMGGGADGAIGAAAVAGAAPTLDKLQDTVQDKLIGAGLSSDVANATAKLIAGGAAAAIGDVSGSAGATAGLNVDTNNRQLHPGDYRVAKILAEKSGGRFSEKEIQDALRYAGLRDKNGSILVAESTREVYVNLENIQSGVTLQDALKSDPNLPLLVGDQRTLLEQASSQPSYELIEFITINTGGASSPYLLTQHASASSIMLPTAPAGTTRTTIVVDGVPYYPLIAPCPAASCTSGDSIAYAIADPGTSAYSEAVARKSEKDLTIATTIVGVGGAALRSLNAITQIAKDSFVLTRTVESATSVGVTDAVETSGGTLTVRAFTAPSGEIVPLPADASMSNLAVRQWYLDQEALIPKLIDNTVSLEQQAKQAWELRNIFRSAARSAMSDQVAAAQLNATRPNLTWEQTVQKYSAEYSRNDLWQQIIDASQRSNKVVNESLGIRK